MGEYSIHLVDGREWHYALEPLYRQHYAEMQARLAADGVPIGDYNPRLDEYFKAMGTGDLLTFIVLENETVVGYSNMYVTNDMHNGERISMEDTIYVLPGHRNGIGRKLAQFIMEHMRGLGVKRITITPVTDLRVGKIWQRMGFKPVAQLMTYNFEVDDVRT